MDFKNSSESVVETNGRVVTGFASIFGNEDLGGDVVHPGAFTKTVNERGSTIKHLWNHGEQFWSYFVTPPIAKILEIREVGRGELPESVTKKAPNATGGLLVKREYLETPVGNEVLANLKAGVGLEMSFGFDCLKWDYETIDSGLPTERRVRNLREVRLYDISDVNFGMNPATVADGSKSWSAMADRIEDLSKEFRSAKSLPENIHKELTRIKNLFDGLFDKQPEPKADSRAEGIPSLTDLLADLKMLERAF